MVPCAQGRIIVETARPAPPHFATCSGYRRRPVLIGANSVASFGASGLPQSPAARPEDLGVTPWFADEGQLPASPSSGIDPRHNSQPFRCFYADSYVRGEFSSTRNSSVEGEQPRAVFGAQRKAYMDLRDAIALLDETCPNPDAAEPSPRTPRTPVNSQPKNKRARSKSSDNSSNYDCNERGGDKSAEFNQQIGKSGQERDKKRPFLRKIGISKTEDRPFLAKLTPRMIGKPYLEKIGPSKAIEKPYLDKIGSSKTIDKFTFNVAPRNNDTTDYETATRVFVDVPKPRLVPREARISFRKRSGKGQLQKMYSFETEDLNSFKGSLSPVKSPRDPLRGASLDDVLESGPSSLPPLELVEQPREEQDQRETNEPKSQSVAELVKCRIMSSEEIISSSSCLCSPQEAVSWGNSPKRKNGPAEQPSVNSPLKRQISSVDLPDSRKSKELAVVKPGEKSPTKSRAKFAGRFGSSTLPKLDRDEVAESPRRRQTSDDVLDRIADENEARRTREGRRQTRQNRSDGERFERRGISSDNLKLSREMFMTASPSSGESRLEILADRRKERRRDTFKQLHSKFEVGGTVSSEETNELSSSHSRASRLDLGHKSSSNERSSAESEDRDEKGDSGNADDDDDAGGEESVEASRADDSSRFSHSVRTVRSVLRKQKSIDQPLVSQEIEARSLRKPRRRIFHEPSQETMDLLTELRKVKSLLKTPSVERLEKPEDQTPLKCAKKISLTDKEFCLSIDRENSFRRPSSRILRDRESGDELREPEKRKIEDGEEKKEKEKEETKLGSLPGPALFERRGLSLDYADEDKPSKPETRAISLASAQSPPSETEEETNSIEFGFTCDSKSYCSDVFNTPTSDETMDNSTGKERPFNGEKDIDRGNPVRDKTRANNHCAEVDIAIPIDQKNTPKRRVQIQGRTSDLYEIISPRSTPFRVKQRLSKISVEETMKQESFTLNKVDCKSVVVQKRNKCFPL